MQAANRFYIVISIKNDWNCWKRVIEVVVGIVTYQWEKGTTRWDRLRDMKLAVECTLKWMGESGKWKSREPTLIVFCAISISSNYLHICIDSLSKSVVSAMLTHFQTKLIFTPYLDISFHLTHIQTTRLHSFHKSLSQLHIIASFL